MREEAYLESMSKDLEGDLILSFKVEDKPETIEKMKKLTTDRLILEVKKYRQNRSLNANSYLWQLLSKMAVSLHTDKYSLYLLMLKRYGVFVDLAVKEEAVDMLRKQFRYVEHFDDGYTQNDMVLCRCFFGSSGYDTKEMSELINGTVEEARELGVEVLTDEEIAHLLSIYEKEQKTM